MEEGSRGRNNFGKSRGRRSPLPIDVCWPRSHPLTLPIRDPTLNSGGSWGRLGEGSDPTRSVTPKVLSSEARRWRNPLTRTTGPSGLASSGSVLGCLRT